MDGSGYACASCRCARHGKEVNEAPPVFVQYTSPRGVVARSSGDRAPPSGGGRFNPVGGARNVILAAIRAIFALLFLL